MTLIVYQVNSVYCEVALCTAILFAYVKTVQTLCGTTQDAHLQKCVFM